MRFKHGGDLGDIAYSLPTIRYMGGGDLVLCPVSETGYRMTRERAAAIRPLLESQPYISSVTWAEQESDAINLDRWRDQYHGHLNLADNVCHHFGVPLAETKRPWLTVEPLEVAEVVFAFGPRWRGHADWKLPVKLYRGKSVFLGLPQEHEAFCKAYGDVPYYPTTDLLQVARVVAGSKLLCCSQSSIKAIGEGIKHRIVTEVCQRHNNTHWERPDACYV